MDCKQKIDVLIIGAGAAGLTAWRELHSAGLRAVLLEARKRIGGPEPEDLIPDQQLTRTSAAVNPFVPGGLQQGFKYPCRRYLQSLQGRQ